MGPAPVLNFAELKHALLKDYSATDSQNYLGKVAMETDEYVQQAQDKIKDLHRRMAELSKQSADRAEFNRLRKQVVAYKHRVRVKVLAQSNSRKLAAIEAQLTGIIGIIRDEVPRELFDRMAQTMLCQLPARDLQIIEHVQPDK